MADIEIFRKNIEELKKKNNRREYVLRNIEALREISDDEINLNSNNAKYRFHNLDTKWRGSTNHSNLFSIANKGDILCNKILKYIERRRVGGFPWGILDNSEKFIGKFINRTMTEEEYKSYLEGKLPFSEDIHGREVYLQ